MKRVYRFLFLSLLFPSLCLFGLRTAQAAWSATDELSFVWEKNGKRIHLSLQEISGQGNVLFLPGSCDGSRLKVSLSGSTELIWGGETVKDGDTLDVSAQIGSRVAASFREGVRKTEILVMRGSAIPTIFINTTREDFQRIHRSKQLDIEDEATLLMFDAEGQTEVSNKLTSFHMHGNSTIFGYKKPYQFKLADKASLEGMGKGKTWMLLANWFDISLIRNQLTYDLCREMGLTGTPDCCQVDLYLNGSYNGTYLLTEKIQLKKDRLDIVDMEDRLEELNGEALTTAKLRSQKGRNVKALKYFDVAEPEDITGGFLLEIEKPLHFSQNKTDAGFVTNGSMCIVIKEPSQPGPEATGYIAELVNDFHNAVLAENGISPSTGKAYSEYIDMHSFAAKIIIEEFTANFDVRAGSQFMYKDSDLTDSLLYAGPGWDYDLTYGNKEDGLTNPLRKDYVFNRSNATSQLYHYLLTHEDFTALTREILEEEFVPAVEILLGKRTAPENSALRSIRAYLEAVSDSAAMNFIRWNPKLVKDITNASGRTFQDAGEYLKNWIDQRFGMMKDKWLIQGT